ncbi:GH36 C-terminal domain-containing protein [Neobacillus niacini]|uniref:GH36 C-terminal domain-containing protein n=1 Tax=Neobacillus niacini TaxID=86668 RepID=UPI003000C426
MKKDEIQAIQYVKEDTSALFVFLDHQRYGKKFHRLKLKGLNSSSLYRYELNGTEWTVSGDFLMNMGIEIMLLDDYDSLLVRLEKMEV